MTAILKPIVKIENRFQKSAERFAFHHPRLAFFAMFIGMPLFVLGAVAACTAAFILPLAMIFGCL